MKEIIEVPGVSAALRRLQTPTSLLVRAGGLLYSCGIPPIDPVTGDIVEGGVGEQTHAIFRVMKLALEAAGSCLENVVKATIFVTNPAQMDEVNAVYRGYFPDNPPARSFVAIKEWPFPFDIEIDIVATVGG